MNKYRYFSGGDYSDCYQCLKCKGVFEGQSPCQYKFCPNCGTRWDGMFDKKNPRYYLNSFSENKYVRFVVECRRLETKRLSRDYFGTQACEPYWSEWQPYGSYWVGPVYITGSSQNILKTFKRELSSDYNDEVRLVLVRGQERKVLMERHTGKYTARGSVDNRPLFSGVIPGNLKYELYNFTR